MRRNKNYKGYGTETSQDKQQGPNKKIGKLVTTSMATTNCSVEKLLFSSNSPLEKEIIVDNHGNRPQYSTR